MKKSKKFLVSVACLALGLGMSLTSCGGDSGSSSGDEVSGKGGSVTYYEAATGSVIKNKIVNLDSDDVYYEYLKFTSETGGEYSLYKAGETENVKQTTITVDGTSVTVPTAFTYDTGTGKFSTELSDGSYLFSVAGKTDADTVYYTAGGVLTADETNADSALLGKWNLLDGTEVISEYTFSKDGTATVVQDEAECSYVFDNVNGLISIDSTNGFYTTEKVLYLPVESTEREFDVEVGRAAAAEKAVSLVSKKSLVGLF